MKLDGNEVFYADFGNDLLVWNQIVPMSNRDFKEYNNLVNFKYICKEQLNILKQNMSLQVKTRGEK